MHGCMGPIRDPDADVSLISVFFPSYHRTRPLAVMKNLDDKGKHVVVVPSETRKDQAKSSTNVSIVYESISLEYKTNTLKVFLFIP